MDKIDSAILIGCICIFLCGAAFGSTIRAMLTHDRHIVAQIHHMEAEAAQLNAIATYYENYNKLLKEFYKSGRGKGL